jgi:hypothetical protein
MPPNSLILEKLSNVSDSHDDIEPDPEPDSSMHCLAPLKRNYLLITRGVFQFLILTRMNPS